jgi:hypothetical protein
MRPHEVSSLLRLNEAAELANRQYNTAYLADPGIPERSRGLDPETRFKNMWNTLATTILPEISGNGSMFVGRTSLRVVTDRSEDEIKRYYLGFGLFGEGARITATWHDFDNGTVKLPVASEEAMRIDYTDMQPNEASASNQRTPMSRLNNLEHAFIAYYDSNIIAQEITFEQAFEQQS